MVSHRRLFTSSDLYNSPNIFTYEIAVPSINFNLKVLEVCLIEFLTQMSACQCTVLSLAHIAQENRARYFPSRNQEKSSIKTSCPRRTEWLEATWIVDVCFPLAVILDSGSKWHACTSWCWGSEQQPFSSFFNQTLFQFSIVFPFPGFPPSFDTWNG